MKQILLLCCVLLTALQACDPAYTRSGCTYQYPIQAQNLRRTIKTSDTIWIENNISARLCLNEGVYANGEGAEVPIFDKIEGDKIDFYTPKVFGYSSGETLGTKYNYYIKMIYDNGFYKSRWGVLFPEVGIYRISNLGCKLRNNKENYHILFGYFKVSSNNSDLLPPNTKTITRDGEPGKYYTYYLQVVK